MVILSLKQSNKKMCHECKKEVKIIFTCSKCGSQFCKDHKNLDAHNCEQDTFASQLHSSSIDTTSNKDQIFTPNYTLAKEAIIATRQREKEVFPEKTSPKNSLLQKFAYPIFFLCIFTIILGIFSIMFFIR
jgi:hypothetical protein